MPSVSADDLVSAKSLAAQHVREAILSGHLQPGERVNELAVARQLNIAITTVREGIFELEREGYVTRVMNKGVRVVELGPEDTRQIHIVRIELEGLAAELCARFKEPECILALRASVARMGKYAARGDRSGFHSHDLEFHRLLWKHSGNRYLERSLDHIVSPLFAFYIAKMNPDRDHLRSSVASHVQVVDSIEGGTPKQARKTMQGVLRKFLAAHERVIHV